ncbi:UPF0496 protein At1g20180 [Magnolia sinica]|uniref:UPF0496 protein At1g20180 n=1 Tax=Magnolia sinica TaxID=86752 RepID=UPI0026593FFF|nr:UPF0496 protein At1g20180 [Magnolia sinica]
MWPKLKSSFTKGGFWKFSRGKFPREHLTNVGNKLNVNEEYMEAFRTKSYTEIWSKVQGQLRRTNEERLSLSPIPSYLHHPEYLLEPRQETLIAVINGCNLHSLIRDYFEGSLEACKICGFLLQCVDQTRTNHCIIQRVLRATKRVARDYTKEQCTYISAQLATFASLENPLSGSSQLQFHQIHDLYSSMLRRLTSKHKKIMRRAKFVRFCKKASCVSLTVACGALTIVMLVVAAHTLFGLLATPIIMCSSTPFLRRRIRTRRPTRYRSLKRLGMQLDAAAKGAYILDRDFDTMSRLATRLHDEIEHSKAVIGIFLRNGNGHLLEEVVNELRSNENNFLEQLGELEEHVYLCFLTINRARRLVFQEIVMQQQH